MSTVLCLCCKLSSGTTLLGSLGMSGNKEDDRRPGHDGACPWVPDSCASESELKKIS